ncbi:hypothetical protein BGX26_002816 [Mortierella sp. AD094]|nr:hypothetical protein BGX26_002816 [Mortierella sp. AD094]
MPDPRTSFQSLLNVKAGDQITSMDLGQKPKFFAGGFQGHEFIVTEQMMGIWEELERDSQSSIKKCLSGPMGIGKSYISWFLAAMAYARGWLVLYVSDANELNNCTAEADVSELICQLFLSINKDILTASELKDMVVHESTANPCVSSASRILRIQLQSGNRKTLFVVDEHGALFPEGDSAPQRLPVLGPLKSFSSWNSSDNARVVFTGTAHAKFERTILRDAPHYLAFVGPLSPKIFNMLLDAVSTKFHSTVRSHIQILRNEVQRITNCVPRELITLSGKIGTSSLTLQEVEQILENFEILRQSEISETLTSYYDGLSEMAKARIRQALADVFLPGKNRPSASFDWKFMDFGIVYRYWSDNGVLPLNSPITPAAKEALLDLYKACPLPADYLNGFVQGTLTPTQFEDALFEKFIKTPKLTEVVVVVGL